MTIIAECKQQSPSKGRLAVGHYDPALQALNYVRHGADAISVLTEPDFFAGSLADLKAVRKTVETPLLRKDFLLDPAQIAESRLAGADAVLVIVRILSTHALQELIAAAESLGMDALVEVHNPEECERALAAGAHIIGVNNRDLDTFQTDIACALTLAPMIPAPVVAVAESGIQSFEQLTVLRTAGFRSALIGEHLMKEGWELLKAVSTWRQS